MKTEKLLEGIGLEDLTEEELANFIQLSRRSKQPTMASTRVAAAREKTKSTNIKTIIANLPEEERNKLLAELKKRKSK